MFKFVEFENELSNHQSLVAINGEYLFVSLHKRIAEACDCADAKRDNGSKDEAELQEKYHHCACATL